MSKATPEGARVLILGASNKTDRYAYKALRFLRERDYIPVPVHPRLAEIDGIPVFADLGADAILADGPIDTVTLYVNPTVVEENVPGIIALAPRRVIMNPGTETESARLQLEKADIEVLEACTLVLLRTGQF